MIVNALSYLELNWIRITKKTEFYQPTFNPRKLPLAPVGRIKRDCQDRLQFIEKTIDFTKIKTLVDVGSQIGYFSLNLASKYELFALGLDHDLMAIRYAQLSQQLAFVPRTAFASFELNEASVELLPTMDLLLFLDVFHHLVWQQGYEVAMDITEKLLSKTTYLVFETGQSDEIDQPWTQAVSFMGKQPTMWLEKYLTANKFRILKEKRFSTHLSRVQRTMYVCSR